MKAFLMIGQSNMAGRGDFGEVAQIDNPLCKMLRNGRFIPMREPINPDRGIFDYFHSGVGLAASFADEYAKHYGEEIGLIPCADGGTRIEEWQPGEILYDHAVAQAKLAQRSAEIVGILWHQGENDSRLEDRARLYRSRFLNTMTSLIRDLSLPEDTPIIVGELGEFVSHYQDGALVYAKDINGIFHALAAEFDHIGVASAEGLGCKEDGIHFTSASYRELGKRYFGEYLKIRGCI